MTNQEKNIAHIANVVVVITKCLNKSVIGFVSLAGHVCSLETNQLKQIKHTSSPVRIYYAGKHAWSTQWWPSNKSSYSSSLIKISSPGIRCEPSARLTTATLRPGMTAKTLLLRLGCGIFWRLWSAAGFVLASSSSIRRPETRTFFAIRAHQNSTGPGSAGKLEAHHFAGLLQRYAVSIELEQGIKERSAGPFASQCEQGMVKLVEGQWNRAFIEDLCACPNGAHDDQVDAASTAFRALLRRITWHAVA